jgi:hypothetical protein
MRTCQPGSLAGAHRVATTGASRSALPRTRVRSTPDSVWLTWSYKDASHTGGDGIWRVAECKDGH